MGQEIVCTAGHDGAASEGKAQLETDSGLGVRFSATHTAYRFVIPTGERKEAAPA